MTIKEKGSWLIASIVENGWNSLVTALWGGAVLALLPALKRIALVAWNSPQTPIPLTEGWARISLAAVAVIAISTIALLVFAWRQGRELRGLQAHTCAPSYPGKPQSFPGPTFIYDGMEWIPILSYLGNDADDRILLGKPQCPKCHTPLIFFGEWKGHCPNEKCKGACSPSKPIATISEMARLDAIGRASRGELIFPGKPGFRPLRS